MRHLAAILLVIACGADPVGVTPDASPPAPDASPPVDATAMPCDLPEARGGVEYLTGSACPGFEDGPPGMARFNNPVNVLVIGDSVYVADRDNDAIRVIDSQGVTTTLTHWESFTRPFGLTEGPPGYLFVQTDRGGTDPTNGALWLVDATTGSVSLVSGAAGRPRGLLFLEDESLLLSDYVAGTVTRWSEDARETLFVMDRPYDLERYSGRYVVARNTEDGEVTVVTADGDHADTLTRLPYSKALATDGEVVYVSARDGITPVVYKVVSGVAEVVAGPEAELYAAEGIDFANGKLYIADGTNGDDETPNHYIRVLTP